MDRKQHERKKVAFDLFYQIITSASYIPSFISARELINNSTFVIGRKHVLNMRRHHPSTIHSESRLGVLYLFLNYSDANSEIASYCALGRCSGPEMLAIHGIFLKKGKFFPSKKINHYSLKISQNDIFWEAIFKKILLVFSSWNSI